MTDYVVGFLFNAEGTRVVLMEKKRPDWQVGKLNGPGGKVASNETPHQAMEREFKEETGASGVFWRPFCQMKHRANTIIYFMGKADVEVESKTDEPARWYDLNNDDDVSLIMEKCVHNLHWLLPLALDKHGAVASVTDPS